MKKILCLALSAVSIAAHASNVDIAYPVLTDPQQAAVTKQRVLDALKLRPSPHAPFFVYVHTKADAALINGWLRDSGFNSDGVFGAVAVPVAAGGFSKIRIQTGS